MGEMDEASRTVYRDMKATMYDAGQALFPNEFTSRLTNDYWPFGVLVLSGDVLVVNHVNSIDRDAAGDIWLNVDLVREKDYIIDFKQMFPDRRIVFAPTDRVTATVKASHVVAAFELADT